MYLISGLGKIIINFTYSFRPWDLNVLQSITITFNEQHIIEATTRNVDKNVVV